MEPWFSVLGAVASIGGAGFAVYQAYLAKGHATAAERLHSDMISQRQVKETAMVHKETTRLLRRVSKVGPSCTRSDVRGLKVVEIARDIEEYSEFLAEHQGHYDEEFRNDATELCKKLHPLIEELSEAKEFDDVKNAGKQIYFLIHEFLPHAKRASDSSSDDALRA